MLKAYIVTIRPFIMCIIINNDNKLPKLNNNCLFVSRLLRTEVKQILLDLGCSIDSCDRTWQYKMEPNEFTNFILHN